ncbi:ACP S-malonyltransferase [Buchananella hordeovulneris]|uniref:ACP S-malonyltransferase n=1 Tax=Buchananella hordeovulneris TaxID=52770 RepID=UPI0026DB3A2B|nr:ACP S-malonyltransferase [Buchananella hordeovulneris]MDO5080338.1 ACP S-malonyltransferase [Buchananella hordeovulneris]
MIAVLCPGQGSQRPGMLAPWLEVDGARPFLNDLSQAAGINLLALGVDGSAADLKDTAVAQPLLVAAGLLAWRALAPLHPRVQLVAGHSVGEITAAAVAEAISPTDAVRIAAARGQAMAAAANQGPATGMSAVVGGDAREVHAAITQAGAFVANYNGAGQLVASGTKEALAQLAANPPARARVVPLEVHGAFHTRFMEPAAQALAAAVADIDFAGPRRTLLSNWDGYPLTKANAVRRNLVTQLTSPVDWTGCCDYVSEQGPELLIELCPAGVLTRIAKRAIPGVAAVALDTPAAVSEVEEKLA